MAPPTLCDLGNHESAPVARCDTAGPPPPPDGDPLSSRMTVMPEPPPASRRVPTRTLVLLVATLLALPLGASQAQTDEAEIPGKTFAAYEFGWYPIHFVDHFVDPLGDAWEVDGPGSVQTQNGMITIAQRRRRDDRRHAARRGARDRPLGDPAARPALRGDAHRLHGGRRAGPGRQPGLRLRRPQHRLRELPPDRAPGAVLHPEPARPVLRPAAAGDEPAQRLLAHLRRRGDAEPDLVVRRRRGARRPSVVPRRSPASRWRSGSSCRPSPARP